MQKLGIFSPKTPCSFWKDVGRRLDSGSLSSLQSCLVDRSVTSVAESTCFKAKGPSILETASLLLVERNTCRFTLECMTTGSADVLSDEDDELCPVECVREFKSDDEFLKILEKAKETKSLVVVDFYRTACGSCKYIEQGFTKLCKGSGAEDGGVIFLKHNVRSIVMVDFCMFNCILLGLHVLDVKINTYSMS